MSESGEKLRILLVEDSEDDACFFNLALRKSGFLCEVSHAVDGGQAIDHLEASFKNQTPPDVIFLDLKLPVLNGFEVLQWIAAQDFRPRLQVVVLSGSDHHVDIRLARE